MKHQYWNIPDTYTYNKETKELTWIKEVHGKKYFDGDDWSWEEWPIVVEITEEAEKARILKERPYLL